MSIRFVVCNDQGPATLRCCGYYVARPLPYRKRNTPPAPGPRQRKAHRCCSMLGGFDADLLKALAKGDRWCQCELGQLRTAIEYVRAQLFCLCHQPLLQKALGIANRSD